MQESKDVAVKGLFKTVPSQRSLNRAEFVFYTFSFICLLEEKRQFVSSSVSTLCTVCGYLMFLSLCPQAEPYSTHGNQTGRDVGASWRNSPRSISGQLRIRLWLVLCTSRPRSPDLGHPGSNKLCPISRTRSSLSVGPSKKVKAKSLKVCSHRNKLQSSFQNIWWEWGKNNP